MATSEIIPAVTRTEVIEVEPAKVVLTLDDSEARVLAAILAKVGGDRAGFRGKADNVSKALMDAGYDWRIDRKARFQTITENRTPEHQALGGTGSQGLYFNDEGETATF